MLFLLPLLAVAADADISAHQTIMIAHAEGAQVYQCKPAPDGTLQWTFREPIASLIVAGQTTGHHYAGPHWALADGSLVQGKVVASTPGMTSADIPLLKLAVIANNTLGVLGTATLVYRIHTHGGVLKGACLNTGSFQPVAYSADYVFAK